VVRENSARLWFQQHRSLRFTDDLRYQQTHDEIVRLTAGQCFEALSVAGLCFSKNLVLRQQLTIFRRKHPRRPLDVLDKVFWVLVRRF
jgi:hypothetical protein